MTPTQRAHLVFTVLLILTVFSSFFRATPAVQTLSPQAHATPPAPLDAPQNTQTLPMPPHTASAHAATAVVLPHGELLAAWFAGSREGAKDVSIWASRFDGRAWSAPWKIADPQQTAHDTHRYIKKVGNPLLALDAKQRLHLWYVSVSVGGWAGSALNHRVSEDGGQHWSPASRLISSPFFNLSTLLKAPPIALADGGWLFPAYHELARKYPLWLRLDAQGRVISSRKIPDAVHTLQPWAVEAPNHHLLAWLRVSGERGGKVALTESTDAGQHWSVPRATELPNPNAAVAALALPDNTWLLAANPVPNGRYELALLHSKDGVQWTPIKRLEQSENHDDEFSYPYLIRDGRYVHVFYTWQRKNIRHQMFLLSELSATISAKESP